MGCPPPKSLAKACSCAIPHGPAPMTATRVMTESPLWLGVSVSRVKPSTTPCQRDGAKLAASRALRREQPRPASRCGVGRCGPCNRCASTCRPRRPVRRRSRCRSGRAASAGCQPRRWPPGAGTGALAQNIFAGINRCDWVAEGVVGALRQLDPKVPVVVRLSGTNVEEGRRILAEADVAVVTADSLAEAGTRAVGSLTASAAR